MAPSSSSKSLPNPYNWQHHEPATEVPRSLVGPLTEELLQGGGAVVIGGRGMGKSVLLQQVRAELGSDPKMRIVHLLSPPQTLTAAGCLHALARGLGESPGEALTCHELFERYFARSGDSDERIVLLYDEFDRYAQQPLRSDGETTRRETAGRDFFNDLESARRAHPRVGVLAVGTLGVFVFRDVLGSSFLSRAARFWMRPFDLAQAERLAQPFAARGTPLGEEVLESLWLMSGGNAALLTFGLQRLWSLDDPTEHDVAASFTRFRDRYGEFLADVENAFSDPSLSRIPQKIWALVRRRRGPLPRAVLEEVCRTDDGVLRLGVAEVLQLLQAAGLIEIDGSAISDDPLVIRPRSGILSLPEVSPPAPDPPQRLRADVKRILEQLYASSADFFRPGPRAGEKKLVPESVFTAFLGLGLSYLGWTVEREAQQVRGRTDLKLRRNGSPRHALVEVKIWGRSGDVDVQRQMEGYWTPETESGVVVMLTDMESPDWPQRYREKCLEREDLRVEVRNSGSESSLAGTFQVESTTTAGAVVRVEHFLVRLPR